MRGIRGGRRAAPTPKPTGFSERESEILHHLVAGMTKNQIAAELRLSAHTVDGHIRKIYMKLHVNNRGGAVAKALKENLVRRSPPPA
jgi:DNA-binding CsgD family transcriptional regulator